MTLRQLMQALCAFPPPPNMIWHYPGFPSLLVTYTVANDFFFSGHTAIAVFGAIELCRFVRQRLRGIAACTAQSVVCLAATFLVTVVLLLRAHYSMDVFAGVLAATLSCCAFIRSRWLLCSLLAAAVVAGIAIGLAYADPSGPKDNEKIISYTIARLMHQKHLSQRLIDDELSKRCFETFLKSLDPM